MEKKFKKGGGSAKFAAFFKKNIYYILIALCVIAVISMITVAAVMGTKTDPPANVNPPVVEGPDDPGKEEPEEPEEPGPPVVTDPFILSMPVESAELGMVFNDSGLEEHWGSGTKPYWSGHMGMDFITEEGAKVFAAFAGKVIKVITDNTLTGGVVSIEHQDGFVTNYKLLGDVLVTVGQQVAAGEQIASVAYVPMNLEGSQGVHLHFELQKNGSYVNPAIYFPEGDK